MRVCKAAGIALCLVGIPAIQGCVGVAATGTVAGGMAAQDRRTSGSYLDDELIELKVLAAIGQDERMASQTHVNTTSFNGLVLLTGEAPGESLLEHITEIARNIPGVQAVQNEVALRAPSTLVARTNDTLVTGRVKLALLKRPGTRRRAGQGGHGTRNRLPHGPAHPGRVEPGHGDCAARARRSTRRGGRGVHPVARTVARHPWTRRRFAGVRA